LAEALIVSVKDRNLDIPDCEEFQVFPGNGVIGTVENKKIIVGTSKFLYENDVYASDMDSDSAKLEIQGKTAIFVSIDRKLAAIIGIADIVKKDSKSSVSDLKNAGIKVFMITGDNRRTARAIAAEVGIDPDNVFAEVLPENKADKVRELQQEKKVVAMVGDGINDAPALTQADVGFAIGSGSDIAIESGDIALMNNSLKTIVTAIKLSRKTMQKIKENLFWAFIYNIIGIPVAALGYLSPIIAGAAMSFSSVSVVTNSLSLKRFNPNNQ
jgi:Cu+-exporting ATPase